MNLLDHPELADRLAAAYGLGTLRGGARRRFEAQARKSPALRAAALAWQERFAGMTELQPGEAPSPNVWKRIEIELAQQRPSAVAAQAPAQDWGRVLRWWRGAAFAGALTAFAALGVSVYLGGEVQQREAQLAQLDRARSTLAEQNVQLASQLSAQPEIRYVAVLEDNRSSASMLVTFDPKHNTLTLKRLGAFQEGPDKSLQLWALPPSGGPRSLGVLGGNEVVKLTAAESQVRDPHMLAISLEPKGGVPGEGGPTGPVLFKGPMLQAP
ncbi:anti-sigma factor [Caenimonas soli]|jgi:anti-sigma-K factor RskA|uniref:anti-sigma factor n=1 Tax=Caenimonas soli TaxID=2735555 RepID=UPI0015541BB7|nr:anti-sigma factor [Caenimonas soli]NPC58430.1 RNA polymerase subunit sigma-70 [Caenimonas soli]